MRGKILSVYPADDGYSKLKYDPTTFLLTGLQESLKISDSIYPEKNSQVARFVNVTIHTMLFGHRRVTLFRTRSNKTIYWATPPRLLAFPALFGVIHCKLCFTLVWTLFTRSPKGTLIVRGVIMLCEKPAAKGVPQELLLKIFKHLEGDRTALKTCARVSKAWNQASRVYLFYSVDLSAVLARNDWLSFFLNIPFGVGDYVRHIMMKNTRWTSGYTSTSARVLAHFGSSLNSLTLSNVSIVDFAHLASTIAKFKHLRSLFLSRVTWETNTVDYSQPIPPYQAFPDSVVSLRLYHIHLGQFMGWLLAQSHVPRISALYAGPIEYEWNTGILAYLFRITPSLLELGFRVLPDLGRPLYAYSPCSGVSTRPELVEINTPLHPELQRIAERFQARHGISIHTPRLQHIGENLRLLRAHRFIYYDAEVENGLASFPVIWFARLLLTPPEDFAGTVILDVDVPSIGLLHGLKVDWEFLEAIFSSETHAGVKAVVFAAVTNISLQNLESFVSTRLPKAYDRGLLRFERGEDLSR